MVDFNAILKQAQKMQERLQKELAELRIEGTSGGGMVTVTMSGTRQVVALKISPEAIQSGDVEMLEDLVVAAIRAATAKVEEAVQERLGGMAGGLGLKLPGLF
jgi:hypothetical protein